MISIMKKTYAITRAYIQAYYKKIIINIKIKYYTLRYPQKIQEIESYCNEAIAKSQEYL